MTSGSHHTDHTGEPSLTLPLQSVPIPNPEIDDSGEEIGSLDSEHPSEDEASRSSGDDSWIVSDSEVDEHITLPLDNDLLEGAARPSTTLTNILDSPERRLPYRWLRHVYRQFPGPGPPLPTDREITITPPRPEVMMSTPSLEKGKKRKSSVLGDDASDQPQPDNPPSSIFGPGPVIQPEPHLPILSEGEHWVHGEVLVYNRRFGLNVHRKVDEDAVKTTLCIGSDPTGAFPLLVQVVPKQTPTQDDHLGSGCKLRASGMGLNKKLLAIPFVACCRPGALSAVKAYVHGDLSSMGREDDAFAEEEVNKWRKFWRATEAWCPPLHLSVMGISKPLDLDCPNWGDKAVYHEFPYAQVPAMILGPGADHFRGLVQGVWRGLRDDYMTLEQAIVYACWWCEYRLHDGRWGSAMLQYDFKLGSPTLVSLPEFMIQMPVVIRDVELWGLAFYPNLMRAASGRCSVAKLTLPNCPDEAKILKAYQDLGVVRTAYLVPGDLKGTQNATFSTAQLIECPYLRAEGVEQAGSDGYRVMYRSKAIKFVVDSLGDVRDIYRDHPVNEDLTQQTILLPREEIDLKKYLVKTYFGAPLDMSAAVERSAKDSRYLVIPGQHRSLNLAEDIHIANRPSHVIQKRLAGVNAPEGHLPLVAVRWTQASEDAAEKRHEARILAALKTKPNDSPSLPRHSEIQMADAIRRALPKMRLDFSRTRA
ncbi:hypothetical protein F5X96DRAFT_547736 [Biscogniauxia mediterranea]|nr:hypothetical protein F5X96DRAFT_547736 [Biscogniauxia mediterranea]